MKLVIGLGNPGKSYENTRHNVGFLMVEKLFHDEWKEEKKFKAFISKKGDTLGIKPQTFMNLSGESVASIVHFYKLDPKNDILVISDDIDMEFGKIRFRASGNHGGQNGLRDIIEKLGTNEFARLKIGIGRNPVYSVSDWVLSKFLDTEIQILEKEVFPKMKDIIEKWITPGK